jgi:hypothetical protein
MGSAQPRSGRAIAVIVGVTTFFTFYPPLYVYLRRGTAGLFRFVEGDALLYLTIARHSRVGFFSFDGETETNGFHPLWQWLLTAASAVIDPTDRPAQLACSLTLCALAVWGGFLLCNLAIHRLTGSVLLSVLPVAGAYWIVVGALFQNQSYYHLLDGMESGLSVLAGGLVLYLMASRLSRRELPPEELARPTWKSPFVPIALILPFLILARLDDVFILTALAAGLFLLPGVLGDKLRTAAVLVAPSALVLALYMLHNKVSIGTWLPLSGMAKSGLAAHSSTYIFLSGLFPPLVDLKNAVAARPSDLLDLHLNMFRPLQMLYPAFFALGFLAIVGRYHRREPRYVALMGLGFYVLLKAAYNFFNVNLWHQGSWYYAFSIMLCSFFVAVLLARPYQRLRAHPLLRGALGALLGLLMLLSAGRVAMRDGGSPPGYEYLICRDAPSIDRALDEAAPGSQLLELDDGVLAFCLDHRSIHGFGFAVDYDTYAALREQRLLAHAHRRGHDVFASAGYIRVEQPPESSEAIRALLRGSILDDAIKRELEEFDFALVHHHRESATGFFRFWPRERARAAAPIDVPAS